MIGPSCETLRLGDACRARDHRKTVKHLPPVYLEVHLEGPSVLAWSILRRDGREAEDISVGEGQAYLIKCRTASQCTSA